MLVVVVQLGGRGARGVRPSTVIRPRVQPQGNDDLEAHRDIASAEAMKEEGSPRGNSLVMLPDSGTIGPGCATTAGYHSGDPDTSELVVKSYSRRRRRRPCCDRCWCPPTITCTCGWFLATILSLAIAWFITCAVGRVFERKKWLPAPGTAHLYDTKRVCGRVNDTQGTYTNLSIFREQYNHSTLSPVHCGACGQCSNPHDMQIYKGTRNTLTKTATRCAARIFYGGEKAVQKCLRAKVGFTEGCNDCWVQNVMCNQRHCKFTCSLSFMLRHDNNNEDTGELSQCLLCDEKMCGQAFLECAGANRRRAGITSDIRRSEDQMCLKSR